MPHRACYTAVSIYKPFYIITHTLISNFKYPLILVAFKGYY